MHEFATKHALLIGVSAYQGNCRLANCASDAQDMGRYLVDKAKFAKEDVRVLVDPDVHQMWKAITWLQQASSANGLALFYFAGHAMMYDQKHCMLGKCYSGEESRIRSSGVAVDDVLKKMERFHSSIVILDACRTEWDSQGSVRAPPASNQSPATGTYTKEWQWEIIDPMQPEGDRAHSNGAPSRILMAHACPLYGAAADGGDLGNGVFTYELKEELFKPNQSVLAAISTANEQVFSRTNGKQDPRLEGRNQMHFAEVVLVCRQDTSVVGQGNQDKVVKQDLAPEPGETLSRCSATEEDFEEWLGSRGRRWATFCESTALHVPHRLSWRPYVPWSVWTETARQQSEDRQMCTVANNSPHST